MSNERVHLDRPRSARLTFHAGTTDGLRTVSTLASVVQVWAAPWAEYRRLMCSTAHLVPYRTYILESQRIYVGHGDDDRQMGSHLKKEERDQTRQAYLIGSQDSRFDKDLANRLEARLIEIAVRKGLPLANGNLPYGLSNESNPPSSDMDELVDQALFLLEVAGCKCFSEPDGASAAPMLLPVTTMIGDVRVIPADELVIPPGATPMKLVCRDLRAEGYQVGDRFWVMPGSDFARVSKSGLSGDNRKRRQGIESADVLAPCAGKLDRARLVHGLDCKSPAIAAKVMSGEHLGTKAWQPNSGETIAATAALEA